MNDTWEILILLAPIVLGISLALMASSILTLRSTVKKMQAQIDEHHRLLLPLE